MVFRAATLVAWCVIDSRGEGIPLGQPEKGQLSTRIGSRFYQMKFLQYGESRAQLAPMIFHISHSEGRTAK